MNIGTESYVLDLMTAFDVIFFSEKNVPIEGLEI